MKENIIEKLAQIYPQLYLNPDTQPQDAFRDVALKGNEPEHTSLSWYHTDPRDKDELLDTPAGKVRAVTLYCREDYEYFVRSMMAAKCGPEEPVPASQGASTLIIANWPRIHAHKRQFIADQMAAGNLMPNWQEEWTRFTAVKSNYLDHLVVLSVGPYSAVDAARMGCSASEWLELSDTIRKYHELTHVICRILYPDQINAVWDELAADAIGLYAAYGSYDPAKERIFLGIDHDAYTGGRLENYTDDPQGLTGKVNRAIEGIDAVFRQHAGVEPFSMIAPIQSAQQELFS